MAVETDRSFGHQIEAYQQVVKPIIKSHGVVYFHPLVFLQIVSWSSSQDRPVRLLEYVASRVPEFGIKHGIGPKEAAEPVKKLSELSDDEIRKMVSLRGALGKGLESRFEKSDRRSKTLTEPGMDEWKRTYIELQLETLVQFMVLLESDRMEVTTDQDLIKGSRENPAFLLPHKPYPRFELLWQEV